MDVVKHGKELCFCEKAALETGEQIPENAGSVFFLGGGQFFNDLNEEKNCCAAGKSGGHCKPSPVGSRDEVPENFA